MRDIAYVKKKVAGVDTLASAIASGHSNNKHCRGVTRKCVGPLQVTLYNERVQAPLVDRLAPKMSNAPIVLRRNTKVEVDAHLDEANMDPLDKNHRARAKRAPTKQQITEL